MLIRVGADRDAVGPGIPSGFDFEKERYIPGIFDSVELILSGTPHFTQVQTAPDLAARSVRVQAMLRNEGEPAQAAVTFVVREAKSGHVAGGLKTEPASLAKGAETTVDVRIPIANCHLWSPEDPFLYTLEADSGTDRFQTRFGMREFRFDPATGRAMLNGKTYFMRGSNFTLYRFFEDSECKDLPWRRDWVRLLHQRVKEMHWNCLRYCIGFPPEAWYDTADEVGILIQDEFPIWTHTQETKREEMAAEYAEWMRERWNHPCVVIWDASNETRSSETGPAIRQVRGLDLSNRPWDNSYTPPQEPGDVFESHPYHFNPNFRWGTWPRPIRSRRATRFATTASTPSSSMNTAGIGSIAMARPPPSRVTSIAACSARTRRLHSDFHMQATWLAADTEFWRAHRKAAAVVHFTMLGYSRPDGQTCDHWKPGGVEKLEWEPEFYRYVRDAFAPVGLAVNFWKDKVIPQTRARIPVILSNDLDQAWSGPITLKLRQAGRPRPRSLKPSEKRAWSRSARPRWTSRSPGPNRSASTFSKRNCAGQTANRSAAFASWTIIDPRSLGLAYLKPATASSVHGAPYGAGNAVDGDLATYWSSTFADPAWLAVDLGEVRRFSRVLITWETAYSKAFVLQVSRDGQNWTDIGTEDNCKGGTSDIRFSPIEARHVRVYGTKRGTEWGHAIREFQVFE